MEKMPENSLLESRKKLAESTGEAYSLFLEQVINQKESYTDESAEKLLASIPAPAQELYRDGLRILRDEMKKNKEILNQREGEEKEYIIKEYIDYSKLDKLNINIPNIDEEIANCKYTEMAGGIPLIGLTHSIWTALRRAGTGSPDGWTTSISNSGSCFIFYPLPAQMDLSTLSPNIRETYLANQFKIKKHELHHVIWGLLERGNFVRESDEATPKLKEAFSHIRHEMVAHILSRSDVRQAIFSYESDEKEVSDAVKSVINLFADIQARMNKDVKSESFIYPIMTSRNFQELRNKITEMAQLYDIKVE